MALIPVFKIECLLHTLKSQCIQGLELGIAEAFDLHGGCCCVLKLRNSENHRLQNHEKQSPQWPHPEPDMQLKSNSTTLKGLGTCIIVSTDHSAARARSHVNLFESHNESSFRSCF